MTGEHTLSNGTYWRTDDRNIEWKLRFAPGSISRADQLVAASILSTWAHVLDPDVPFAQIEPRLRELRRRAKDRYDGEGGRVMELAESIAGYDGAEG